MNDQDEKKLGELFRKAMPPVADTEPERDLWPEMLRRLGARPIRVAWLDWALAALLVALLLSFPEVISVLLYQL